MIININLSNNRTIECDTSIIGKTYENEATILKFNLTEEMIDKDFYIEFEKPDETKLITPKLAITTDDREIIKTHGTVEYSIPNSLLDLVGELKLEVVLRNADEMVWKSYALKFNILEAINATETIPEQYPDFVSEAEKVMNLIEFDGEGNKYLSNDGTYKELQSGSSDYDNLDNKPVIRIIDQEEPVVIRNLESGQYIFKGRFKAYKEATSTYSFSSPCFVNLVRTTSKTSMQLFYPIGNRVQFFEITDSESTYQNIGLSNLATISYVNEAIEKALNNNA